MVISTVQAVGILRRWQGIRKFGFGSQILSGGMAETSLFRHESRDAGSKASSVQVLIGSAQASPMSLPPAFVEITVLPELELRWTNT
jgi:hypothetical protein